MILLDTHILIWWINQTPNKLKPHVISLIEEASQPAISCISCLEVAWLVKRQRICLEMLLEQWIDQTVKLVDILPVTGQIALQSAALPEHHRDPMDRLIISTALHHQIQLLSFDSEFAKYRDAGLQLIDDQF